MRQFGIIAAAATLAACADTERAGNTVELDAASSSDALGDPAAGDAAGSNETAAARAPGETEPRQWFARTTDEGSWAGFGPPNSEASFSVRCEGEQLVFGTTEVPRSGPGQTTMHLSAGGVNESIRATASEEGLPNTEASVPASAGWLQQLQSGSGNLTVRIAGGDALVVPISDPLTSLIGDCRR